MSMLYRKAHVTIDNVSKICDKLALHTLSEKVAVEMEECDREATVDHEKIHQGLCKILNIFSDPTLMKTSNNKRMTELKTVLEYFTEISDSLIGKINCCQTGNKNYI